jgi:hypothetical protein
VVGVPEGPLPEGQVRALRTRHRPLWQRHADAPADPLPPIARLRGLLPLAACTLAACGGGGGAPEREADPLRDLASVCLKAAPERADLRGLPVGLLPPQRLWLTGRRASDTVFATAIVDATMPETHDAILRRAPGTGWKVDRHELEAKDAEVYLSRGRDRLTVRMARAGRCAGATSVLYAAVFAP